MATILNLIGNSTSVSVVSGELRLLGLTSPADQLYLDGFRLSTPNMRINALKETTFIKLNKSDFL